MRLFTLLSLCLITWASGEYSTSSPSYHEGLANVSDVRNEQRVIEVWKLEPRSLGWTSWSEWSTCSRTCDGGVSHQLRRCTSQAGCKGEPVRHKICNMQPCPEHHDFRDSQCSTFNSIPYEGQLYLWLAHYDDLDPCTLTCRGRPHSPPSARLMGHLGSPRDESSASSGGEEDLDDEQKLQELEDEAYVVARLKDRVHDGTRCRPGSLDMCIDGKCRRVGCDLRIGSTKKVDACGVCGGDGTSCAQPLYHWTVAPMSLCSVTCGGGYKMSRPVCQNRVSGAEVEQQLCNAAQKPDATMVQCNTHKCPPKWVAGEWGPCSVSCGGGSRLRQVQCVEEANNTRTKVGEHNCRGGHKPKYQEACNQIDCPKWRTSPWSGCSVSCGTGVQVRVVECRDNRDNPSVLCSDIGKPDDQQPCATGIACPVPEPPEDDHLDELLPGLYHTQPLLQPYPPEPPPPPAHAERLVGQQVAPSDPTFIAEEWGPCSASCGKGIRRRDVNCKIFLEISRTIAKLPDGHCPGPKPEETETCTLDPCPVFDPTVQISNQGNSGYMDEPYRMLPTKYSWKEQGFTHCSASCLGGVQELIVNCVREDNQKVTSAYLCPPESKPQVIVRTCNEHPCPPRWNYSDFQPCTKSCGFGIQTREVNCINEVNQGGGNNIVVIPNHMCPQPPPPDRQYCNVLDCPVKWHHTEWSKCSKSCGGGIKERKVECKQVMAQNHVVDRPPAMCPASKPLERRPCNTKSCVLESEKPEIIVSNSSYIQHDPKKKKISVKIGGSATVFYGTMIKIKCHVKRFNRTKILWAKDHDYIQKSKKFKISKKGALRIQNLAYSDSGVYTCMAGKSSADLALTVKPKPGEFPSSEEIDRSNQNRIQAPRTHDIEGFPGRSSGPYHQPVPFSEDNSHEQKPGAPQPLPKQISRGRNNYKPTMPPSMSQADPGHKLNGNQPHQGGTTREIDENEEDTLPSQLPAAGTPRPPLQAEVPRSSATRPLPHFQQLLANLQQFWPFQTFSQSRGHQLVTSYHPEDHLEEFDHLEHLENHPQDNIDDDDLLGHAVVLGKGTADNLKFDWMITEWTECSQSCGGNGFQMRTASCMVRLHNTSQPITASLCSDAGLATPPTIRKCGWDACPIWVTSPWSPCNTSRCLAWETALQKRAVTCQVNGIVIKGNDTDGVKCEEAERPPHRRECKSERCKAVWKPGEWSDCASACEEQGVKYRVLQCLWNGTKKSAGSACKDQPRPSIMKVCRGPPCPRSSWDDCLDHSSFCPQVKSMNLCGVARYHQQCCQSCSERL